MAITYVVLLFIAPETNVDRAFTYLMIGLVIGAALGALTHAARNR